MNRYERQMRIPGWEQTRLAEAHVVLVGAGLLAGFIGWALAALGVGRITILDDHRLNETSPIFPGLQRAPGHAAAANLAYTLQTLNPTLTAHGLTFHLWYAEQLQTLPPADCLIEATDDLQAKEICLTYGQQEGKPIILASATPWGGVLSVAEGQIPVSLDKHLLAQSRPQGVIASQLIGGLAAAELRRLLLPLPADTPLASPVHFHALAPQRLIPEPMPAPPPPTHTPLSCLIIGAGALGTQVALSLALQGVPFLRLVDPDTVEESNLNRQLLFYEAVGQPKATHLAQKLRQLAPGVYTEAIVDRVQKEHLAGIEVIFLCVDNFATRATVNTWAIQEHLPLINGGTGPFAGEVRVYQPGQTACLECAQGIGQLAQVEKGQRARCGEVTEASIVTTNQIIAALMVGEWISLCSLEQNHARPGVILYEAQAPARLGVRPGLGACRCEGLYPARSQR